MTQSSLVCIVAYSIGEPHYKHRKEIGTHRFTFFSKIYCRLALYLKVLFIQVQLIHCRRVNTSTRALIGVIQTVYSTRYTL